jgi:UrcA family protein
MHVAGHGDECNTTATVTFIRERPMTRISPKQKFYRYALAGLAVCAASTVTLSASAAEPRLIAVDNPADGVPAVRVRYDDIDLSSSNGAQLLYRRISTAAAMVCPGAFSRDLSVVAAGRECRAHAVSRAVRAVNNPQLAMVHASHVRPS